ncbi:hypothetical protein GF391_04390 [Candidatus Uhrbacteria bacterium]|nr:hypothetical protein [Candidatus Uhrbacteria bacterium]
MLKLLFLVRLDQHNKLEVSMDGFLREQLRQLFLRGAVVLRRPQYKSRPFKVDLEILDSDPMAREAVFKLLGTRVDAGAYDVIASVPDDCRNLAGMYAAKEGLHLLQPVEMTPDASSPLMLYGKARPDAHVLVIAALNKIESRQKMETHSVVRTLNVLRQNRLDPRKIIILFDADRRARLKKMVNESYDSGIALEAIFDMTEVFRMLLADPQGFNLEEREINEAKQHYEQM